MTDLTQDIARHFARTALGHVAREYPHKLDHVLGDDEDALPPHVLHPCFFGSFDWHSCVHGWWTLLTLRRLYPDLAEATEIAALAESTFTPEKLAVELAYLDRPGSAGFERPYGWARLLYLHLEATRYGDAEWGARLEPLARAGAAWKSSDRGCEWERSRLRRFRFWPVGSGFARSPAGRVTIWGIFRRC